MALRRRKVHYEAPLIVIDGPQLICLSANKSRFLALAIPEQDGVKFDFIAVSVSPKNWERYLDSRVDLRFLFTYPFQRTHYTLSSEDLAKGELWLSPYDAAIPEEYLPEHGLFATDHTEEYAEAATAADEEQLFIDGEWEMPEFGKFYQKYSDIYAFLAALNNFRDKTIEQVFKGRIMSAFRKKPFQGGSSYLHLFNELDECLPRHQKLTLDAIKYASPGDVKMNGTSEIFAAEEAIILNYLSERKLINDQYGKLREYLSRRNLLTAPGDRFLEDDPDATAIREMARGLCSAMRIERFEDILALANENSLVAAKVVLSVQRRVEAASMFFAEGRMAFER